MVTIKELRAAAENRLLSLQAIVEVEFNMRISLPRIGFRLRGTSAGRIDHVEKRIDFNPILMRNNAETFVETTVAHEYAHHVDVSLFGMPKFTHGRGWQKVMRALGVEPRVSHDYDISKIVPTFTCHCACTAHQVSRHVHRQMTRGQTYQCVVCSGPITMRKG